MIYLLPSVRYLSVCPELDLSIGIGSSYFQQNPIYIIGLLGYIKTYYVYKSDIRAHVNRHGVAVALWYAIYTFLVFYVITYHS